MATQTPLPDRVIAAFGGLSKMARALGHKHVTTVHAWQKAGRIPDWRWHEIRAAATRANVNLPKDCPKVVEAAA